MLNYSFHKLAPLAKVEATGFSELGEMGGENLLILPFGKIPPGNSPAPKVNSPSLGNHVLIQLKLNFSCSHFYCTIFIFTPNTFYPQVVVSLILIGVQYLQNTFFIFEKDLNGQNYSFIFIANYLIANLFFNLLHHSFSDFYIVLHFCIYIVL